MSADGDTFDIDIYGDDIQDEQTTQAQAENADDDFYGNGNEPAPAKNGADEYDELVESHNTTESHQTEQQPHSQQETKQPHSQEQKEQQGTKRKAPSDDSEIQLQTQGSLDPDATIALKLTELNWWTTEEEIRAYCAAAQAESGLVDFAIGEHKINGKSRGEAYLEFSAPTWAFAVKNALEKKETKDTTKGEAKRVNTFRVYYTAPGNPFKGRDTGAINKKEYTSSGPSRGGAYNNFNNRGSFSGRGGGGYNRGGGGGGYNRGGGYMNNSNNSSNNNNNNMMNNPAWGMSNSGMGMNFAANPMMAMAGFGNMARGGMGGMMGRGGFGQGMANMGAMMGMAGRGGGGMMMGNGRNGWAGGNMMGGGGSMQQNYGGGGYGAGGMGMQQQMNQGQQQGQPNKRMKAE